jgi:hypothetical protein
MTHGYVHRAVHAHTPIPTHTHPNPRTRTHTHLLRRAFSEGEEPLVVLRLAREDGAIVGRLAREVGHGVLVLGRRVELYLLVCACVYVSKACQMRHVLPWDGKG